MSTLDYFSGFKNSKNKHMSKQQPNKHHNSYTDQNLLQIRTNI